MVQFCGSAGRALRHWSVFRRLTIVKKILIKPISLIMTWLGICGGSASGKTTVATKIIESLDVPWVTLLSMDSFYKVIILHTLTPGFMLPWTSDVVRLQSSSIISEMLKNLCSNLCFNIFTHFLNSQELDPILNHNFYIHQSTVFFFWIRNIEQ